MFILQRAPQCCIRRLSSPSCRSNPMALQKIGIIMNGVTGRMGTNQHLIRSILAIRDQGGVPLANGDVLMPDPILVGRNERKVQALAETHGVPRWSTDLDQCLADPANT